MTKFTRRTVLAASGSLLALSACVPALVPAPPPELEPLDYTARRDGAHRLRAIDIEAIPEFLHRQIVPFTTEEEVGTIVIENQNRLLYLVLENGYALRYGLSVGREGFDWTGESTVYRKAHWPTWTPPPEMIKREPHLERWKDGQPGGPDNPLGARALYLMTDGRDQGYRIHGTPEWRSIGRFASSGCFRMLQQDVIDLYDRVPIGTRVVVV
ncbi:lipoprotein-anchoring transpeptidase ErfK/SrfK [Roseinatronobacter thiooxidans]|jgi:lipoprotein-anchoring transpeptidase ErfK/SrfK|uniref:Lipoprotein-anchoring transpeptidase ErfK/SrfK n=1 Tax=Roseinatronobacter thiooxidans TaxID=121821 RepID=A0A2W7QKW9_9RHOB|nr:L,D-transpeptidase [Roseinatronobacter thiooxidans]PZX46670.1 lipoprotein-anchoring transpeptidase ErfK/SrfK [Roseinatronobacter thiooxidans]